MISTRKQLEKGGKVDDATTTGDKKSGKEIEEVNPSVKNKGDDVENFLRDGLEGEAEPTLGLNLDREQ